MTNGRMVLVGAGPGAMAAALAASRVGFVEILERRDRGSRCGRGQTQPEI
jgi:thioredoxin reductase